MIHIRLQRQHKGSAREIIQVGSHIAIYNICRQFLLAWRTNDICDSSVNICRTDTYFCMLTKNKLHTINKPTEILNKTSTGPFKDIVQSP
jgi:hypothetical protein